MPNGTATYTLKFNADTSQAKKEIDVLKNSLNNLAIKTDISDSGITGINKAIDASVQSATKLRVELEKATNPNGTLNAGKLSMIWKESGKSLTQYKNDLLALGPAGEQAFQQLVRSIRSAEEPVRELDGLIGKFTKGLVNTAMWTIQSNAIHAFQSALSGAFSYAQQLNKGLTDIAIVADMSSAKLAQFAKDANKYAQQWSTTTNEYVKGALIYYQQGLSGEEVIEKTNTTVKLANTSGETAEQISSYMTAIWNNFDDGSKSVEYYADVISYLGAATAASNADIAEGMQAFAATADTVGLSYEYAASALTTLRHVTQQSASTIGNSLKTIFARLSSLKTGETTEDGVDLTKYTKELAAYGVNVLDVNGELKDMDQILDDLAKKWTTLSDAQKVALAQTVGGVRQYNNLISLMDNYEYFQELVQGSYNSTGYLDKQAKVFEDSWQGALNHIQTAIERLYNILIDDKLIIGFTNGLAKIIDATGMILENIGGLKTIIPLISGLIAETYGNKIASAFKSAKDNISNFLKFEEQKQGSKELKNEASELGLTLDGGFITDKWENLGKLQIEYNDNLMKAMELSKNLSEEEKNQLFLAAERNKYQLDYLANLAKEVEEESNRIYGNEDTAIFDALEGTQHQIVVAESILSQISKINDKDALAEYGSSILSENNFKINDETLRNQLAGLEFSDNLSRKSEIINTLKQYIENLKNEIEETITQKLKDEEDNGINSNLKNLKAQKALIEEKIKANENDKDAKIELLKIEKEISTEEEKRKTYYENEIAAQKEIEAKKLIIEQHTASINTEGERQVSILEEQRLKLEQQRASLEANLNRLIAIGTNLSTLTISMNNIWNTFGNAVKDGKLDFKTLATNVGLFGGQFFKLITNIGKIKPEFWQKGLGSAALPILEKLGFKATETGLAISGLAEAGTGAATTSGVLAAKLGAIIPVFGKILLAILAVVAAFKALKWLWENFTPEGKLSKFTREAEESADAAQKAQEAYDDLITTLAKLDDKKDSLSKLNHNTYEWKKGVAELNKETQELIEKLHLASDAWEIQDGVIVIKEEYRQQAIDEAQEEASNTYAQSLFDNVKRDKQNFENNRGITDVEYASMGYGTNMPGTTSISSTDGLYGVGMHAQPTIGVKIEPEIDPLTEDSPEFIDYKNSVMFLINNALEGPISNGALNEVADHLIKEGLFGELINSPEELSTWLADNLKGVIQDAIDNNRLTEEDARIPWLETAFHNALSTAISHGFEKDEVLDMMDYIQQHWEDLDLPADIQNDKAAIVELVDDILRFNRACEDTRKNYDDWMSSLETGNIQELSTALKEMRSTYGDLLDMDGDNFSEQFVKSKKNLDLMKEAINGNEKAYKQLYEIAKQDLYANLHINIEDVSRAENALENFARSVYGRSWDDIEVGVFIDDTAAIQSLNNLINAAADTADTIEEKYAAMNDVLAASGVDADIEQIEVPESQKEQYIDAIPEVNYEKTARVPTVVQDGMGGATVNYTDVPVPTINYTGEPDAPVEANEGEKTVTVFRLKNARKASGGGFKYKHSTAGGGNNGNKGGGGGGGSHEKKTKEKGTQRYHEVTAQLKQNKNALELLNQSKDRAFGRGRIDSMKQEIELLKQQASLYKQLANEAQGYFDKDREHLANAYGAKFNPDGTIDNFEAWYDSWVDKYNSGAVDDDWWKGFEDAIKKYEESLDKLHEAEKGYRDAMYKIYDERLEIIVYKVEWLNGLIEDSTEYLDYLIKKLDEDMYDTAETVAKMGDKASNILKQIGNVQQGIINALTDEENHPKLNAHKEIIEEYLKGAEDGEDNLQEVLNNIEHLTDKEQEQLREWIKELIKYNEQLREVQKEAYDKIIESVEEFNEKIERQGNIVQDVTGIMQHYANVIDIIGKDTLGISDAMMNALSDLQVTGAQSNLIIATNLLNQNKEILADIQKNLEEARERGTESDIKHFEEALEKQEDIVRGLAEDWADAYENALKSAQDAFTNGVKLATEAFDKAVSGSIGSLDKLQDFYDKQTTLQDIFLPDYERIHDLSKLVRDVNNAINNTDNIKGKERLRNLQEDILRAQQEGTQLSKYDVEFMQKRLELEQAQIAMEEARNAKNLVRMTRDNEGNWSYTYTQNPEDLAKAQQNYEDKLYDLEKLNQERVKETQRLMLDAMTKFRDEMANADMNDQEKTQALLDYWRQLQEEYGALTDTALKDGKWITDTYDASNHELTDSFEETLLSLGTGYETLEDFMNDFRSASNDMSNDIIAQYQKWGDYVRSITEAAGINFDNFAQRVADDMDLVIAAIIGEDGEGGAVGVAKQLADELGISIDDILEELRAWWDGPEGRSFIMEAEIAENEKIYEQLEKLIENADQIPLELPKISQAVEKIANNSGSECGCGATCTTTCWTDCGSNCANYTRAKAPEPTGCQSGCFDYCQVSCLVECRNGSSALADEYATGGYTGSWGIDGKLAILHEKELVLNKEDTANMLQAVGFVRDLVEMIGINATSMGNGLGNLFANGVTSGGNYLDQNVTIHAEFPNATNHSEIEEAFENLIGLAGQYAGRKQ